MEPEIERRNRVLNLSGMICVLSTLTLFLLARSGVAPSGKGIVGVIGRKDVHREHSTEQIGPGVAAEWATAGGGR